MNIKQRVLDFTDIISATYHSKQQVEHILELANSYIKDPEKDKRLLKCNCLSCYYSSRIGGAAMTTTNCSLCGTSMNFGSTCIDKVCLDCAKKFDICAHCGADIDLKIRRKDPIKKLTPRPKPIT